MRYSHLLVSVAITLTAYMAGYNPLMVAVAISAYWAGREVAQAEDRFIQTHTATRRREDMPILTAYYNRKAWNRKSLMEDMLIPAVGAIGLALALPFMF